MSDRDLSQRLEVACRLARQAGQLVMRYSTASIAVQRKADDSPVTQADREAELLLRREIEAAFPNDAILGEEHAAKEGSSAYRWILDPIDGTKSFIAGVPLFGTLIGVQRENENVLGVIELPALDVRVHAAKGQGAWWQSGSGRPQPARVSQTADLKQSLYVTSDAHAFAQRGASTVHEQLERAVWYARTWGDCYGYFLVATGRAAVMVDPIMNVWDAAAVFPVLVEAGGTFTDWSGNARIDGNEGIGTNRAVLEQVLAITRPFAGGATQAT
jgi:histidinol phosphatase-like enzyme (inositol monophosphatase family)